MKQKFSLIEKVILKIITHKVRTWFTHEKQLAQKEEFIQSSDLSPEKTWPNPDNFHTGNEIPFSLANIKVIGKYLRSCVSQGERALTSLKKNRDTPSKPMTDAERIAFEAFAKSLGIGAIGYTKVPSALIFKERAICYCNAIVLTMEMDKEKLALAPSIETFEMVFETYDRLGILTNQLADYLREKGFNSHAGHPLGGLVLYPPLAKQTGLGWLGHHGLLITKEFGSRQRLAAIYTDIPNLPFAEDNAHEWIGDYCNRCNRCIRKCPVDAILKEPIVHPSTRVTHLDRSKCLPYFVNHQGCSICVKECPFSNGDYEKLKTKIVSKS